jgi:hypothetical protein
MSRVEGRPPAVWQPGEVQQPRTGDSVPTVHIVGPDGPIEINESDFNAETMTLWPEPIDQGEPVPGGRWVHS